MRSEELREIAADCLRQAQLAENDADKVMFLRMAEAWLALARRREAPGDVTLAGQTSSAAGTDERTCTSCE